MSKYPFQTPYLTIDSWLSYLQKQNVSTLSNKARKTQSMFWMIRKMSFKRLRSFSAWVMKPVSYPTLYLIRRDWYEVCGKFSSESERHRKSMPLPKQNVVMWNPGEMEPD